MPASEVRRWQAIYELMPWDYEGLDFLISKLSMQIASLHLPVGKELDVNQFMTQNGNHGQKLNLDQFKSLNDVYKRQYWQRYQLSIEQYDCLEPEMQKEYSKYRVSQVKMSE